MIRHTTLHSPAPGKKMLSSNPSYLWFKGFKPLKFAVYPFAYGGTYQNGECLFTNIVDLYGYFGSHTDDKRLSWVLPKEMKGWW